MSEKTRYKTQQRAEIDAYLESVPGKHMTAADICAHFREQGRPIGTSTIYRQLERMIDAGLVKKYVIDQNSPACFEYVGGGRGESGSCFHCKCEKCGKLIHLHCGEMELIEEHLLSRHGFFWNPMRTVFYGICGDCRD